MKLISGINKIKNKKLTRSVVAIGNFDGVHKGHQIIVKKTIKIAQKQKAKAGVFTFRPHPRQVLGSNKTFALLCSFDKKSNIFANLGLDFVIEEPFNKRFSKIKAGNFFKKYLVEKLNAKVIVVGYDFSFGKKREGNLQSLSQFCKDTGIKLVVVSAKKDSGKVISSTRIRNELAQGNIKTANLLLKRPFSYCGFVNKGKGVGKKLGFPTANISIIDKQTVLPFGVYITKTKIYKRKPCPGKKVLADTYNSISNLGVQPTFQNKNKTVPVLETFIFNYDKNLVGKYIEVSFFRFLRYEQKFKTPLDLQVQVQKDIKRAKKYFK